MNEMKYSELTFAQLPIVVTSRSAAARALAIANATTPSRDTIGTTLILRSD
jgi:hypothetical protein